MKIEKRLLMLLAIGYMLTACTKEQVIGPQGVRGEDGTTIYSGTDVPEVELGIAGDFYFRTVTGDFYGPKSASDWGTPVSLRGQGGATGQQGPRGPSGSPGSRILSGTSAPTAAIGITGDWYIQTANAALYGPKTASGWGNPISLRGPQGPAGPPGTANVVSSDWIDYQINATPNTTTVKTMEYSFPANVLSLIGAADIATFLSNGGILILYGKNFGNTQHKMLPYNYSDVDYTWMSKGKGGANAILIRIASTDGSDLTDYDYAGFRGNDFRYVLIPAGVRVNGLSKARDIDWSKISYLQAKEMLGLKDE